ncbi:MAG: sugar phosphate isomerase/epimerase [Firmicutes bacterium]|nr:sugar phosphate isomerase/epimerase [Bacillota bacterium]
MNTVDRITLACSSSAFLDIPITEAIKTLADIGYRAIEIRAGHEKICSNNENPSQLIASIKECLSKHKMAVSNISVANGGLCSDIRQNGVQKPILNGDIQLNESYIEQIKYYASLARELRCESLTISPGRAIKGRGENTVRSCLITGLNNVTKFARGVGVSVGVTYGQGLILQTASDVQALFPKVRGLKLAFHTGNAHLACETPCVVVTELKNYIKHIHIADVGNGGRVFVLPNEGEIEWISFFRTLNWIGYRGFVTVDLSSYRDMPDLAAKRACYYLSNLLNAFGQSRKQGAA